MLYLGQETKKGNTVNFTQAIKSGFKNYVNFRGVATRPEYWYWVLFTVIVSTILNAVDNAIGGPAKSAFGSFNPSTQFNLFGDIWNLATLLPSLGLLVRRLRDAGYSMKRLWLYAVPIGLAIVGLVLLLPAFFTVSPSHPNPTLSVFFILGAVLLVIAAGSAFVIGILFIVWTAQPSKAQPGLAQTADLPSFINPPGHPDSNTQY